MEEEDEGSPEEHLELKEMREMLDKAIDELPEKCRLVFLMSREEGLKRRRSRKYYRFKRVRFVYR